MLKVNNGAPKENSDNDDDDIGLTLVPWQSAERQVIVLGRDGRMPSG